MDHRTCTLFASLFLCATAVAETPKYLDPTLPVEERVNDLLPRLTLEEKVIQLSDSWGILGIPRLKIPALLKTEGLHGQSYSTGATTFPQAISMATTFDPALIQQVGKATAIESKAANLRMSWSPVLDVARDARWGRVEETYGEDPYLVGRMGVAWINGFQGEGMIAAPKHVAGHGEPLGGRDSNDVGLSERVMRTIHLAGFRAAVKEAKAGGAMAAYSAWNGVPDNASVELLQKILREEWGFEGLIVTDCGGPEHFVTKHAIVDNLEDACRLAIQAGIDMECGSAFKLALASAVENGVLQESEMDPNLRRVLRAKFQLGLFEKPSVEKMNWEKLPEYDTPEHRALAREVSVKGSVLLKNDKKLLPLSKSLKTIAVIGPNADLAQPGDYSPRPSPGQFVTVLQGVKSHVSPETKVLYAKGCDVLSSDTSGFAAAVETARQADVVILVVGDQSADGKSKATTGENHDGATLEFPGVQRQLVREIQAVGKPVVLVLVNGKPFTLAWEDENIPAILETWYPGQEGGNATADLIFGDQNPSGRLPITFPRHVGQLPLRYNYETSGRKYDYYDLPGTALYRFGHGLSYTTFRYSNLKAMPKKDDPGFVTVSVDIENTGERDGDEVAQLYITDLVASVVTPVIQLEGFRRVSLKKGEKKTVTFELTPYQLSLYDSRMERVLEQGKFRVHVGGVSPEPPEGYREHKQKIGFTKPEQGVSGEFEVSRRYKADFFCELKSPESIQANETFPVTVTVKNEGNLLDVAEVKLFGETLLDTRRFEIEPGETRSHVFNVSLFRSGPQNLTALIGQKVVSRSIKVGKAPAKLELSRVRTTIGDDGVLRFQASARNVGSDPFKGSVPLSVDGTVVQSQEVNLDPGMQRDLVMQYAFPRSGSFRVKIGDAAEKQVVVPGGISLALQQPVILLDFEDAAAGSAKDAISGKGLALEGKPQVVPGKEGNAIQSMNKTTYVKAGNIDLYRKSFSLAAWVNIAQLGNGGQAAFFGGEAPMGADMDKNGTSLFAGVVNEKLLLSFFNRDVRGNKPVPVGKWVHVGFTYDAKSQQANLYLDGKPDGSKQLQPFAGQLEMIGSSNRFNHGAFAMDDVLVTRDVLSAPAMRDLATKGLESLRAGKLVTEWRPMSSAPVEFKTWAALPAGTGIKLAIETADKDGKPVASKTVEVKAGETSVSLKELKPAAQIRLLAELTGSTWGVTPVLQTGMISTAGEPIRWSMTDEWKRGNPSPGIKIGQ